LAEIDSVISYSIVSFNNQDRINKPGQIMGDNPPRHESGGGGLYKEVSDFQ
jgi:hypothetical protein